MELSKFFVPAPKLRAQLNIGCLQDIPTGNYLIGAHGESILLGGMAYVEGVGGRGNMGKSTYMFFRQLTAYKRYCRSTLGIYDTETSLRFSRLNALYRTILGSLQSMQMPDLEDTGRVSITDNTVMTGNKWFAALSDFAEEKRKNAKEFTYTTPFIDPKTNKHYTALYPSLFGVDSLSQFMTDSVEAVFDKSEVGDSSANTVYMKGGNAKSQMLMQMPTTTGSAGLYVSMSLHVGDQIVIDQYNTPAKLLSDMKGNIAFKHVPKNITFLTNNLWYVLASMPLQHKETKTPLYPKDSSDNMAGDTDLRIMQVQNLRAKNGPTGMPFELIWSQSEGILPGLSEFNYIKSFNRYGLGGNDRTYYLELLPDLNLSRTTIRGKIDSHPELRRALEITSEMCQMQALWDDTEGLFCTPLELYKDLKALGYDWSVLLNTRGYWVFEEDSANELPFLSTMDLLRMRKGLYHPWWMAEKPTPVKTAG